jgi:hypothetical protein
MSGDTPDPGAKPAGEPRLDEEALSRLEKRLDRASEAAERLIIEAAARAPGGAGESAAQPGAAAGRVGDGDQAAPPPKPPPAGWQGQETDEPGGHRQSPGRGEIDFLLEVLGALRDRIPPELQHRLGQALREVLLALRALIDWYLERSQQRRSEPVEVQDIPIV